VRTCVSPIALAALLLLVPSRAWADWPEFRGPWGSGHAAAAGEAKPRGLPLRWSETRNVRWKTAIPHRGWSTPVVLGGQVWLTTATRDGRDFFAICVDAETGAVRRNDRLFHAADPEPLGNGVNCYASPSPAIEPGRVYIHFGSYGTACLDTATGKVLWQRTDLPCRHYRGPGSSVVLFENLLILTMDGVDRQYLVALDKASGRTVWKTSRSTVWRDLDANGQPKRDGDFRKAFSTPLVIDVGGTPQMVSPGSMCAFAYDPRTGEELWKVRHTAHTSVLRPVFGQGLRLLHRPRRAPAMGRAAGRPGRRDRQSRGVASSPGRPQDAVARGRGRAALRGQRQRRGVVPGDGHGEAGLAGADRRELRGVARLCRRADLLL